ncbi:MAG: ABC transporter permease [Ignavibacteriae bacterium]|nr:ABC transporter permease [Ignavibacteriota bacterium]
MRTILFILRKEFLQIFRNKAMIPIIFFMPVFQLLILSNAATYEIKNIRFSVVDLDQSRFSRELVSKFTSTGYFILTENSFSVSEAEEGFRKNTSKLVLNIPQDFEKNYRKNGKAELQAVINAEDGSAAGIIYNYTSNIIQQFASGVVTEWTGLPEAEKSPVINISYSNWFNPELDYKTYMVPGILVALVSMVGVFLSGMNIVKEKEIGTIEQLNVTPIKKGQFIIGKLMPFWIIGIFELAFGMTLGFFIFSVPMLGSPFLILIVAGIYLLVILGMGLFISTFTNTQQQAMFIAWFFFVIFMLMGGIFTPIESMPDWAQTMTLFNPIAHFSRAMRMIMLKGSGLQDILKTLYILGAYAVVMLTFAVIRYRKVEG